MTTSSKLSVILLENIEGLGEAGSILEVKEGYARNYLFPHGKAALATKRVKEKVRYQDRLKQKEAQKEIELIQAKAEKMQGAELQLSGLVKEGDELYAKLSASHISKELAKTLDIKIRPKDIVCEPITRLGTYDAILKLSQDVEVAIKITVVNEQNA